MKLSPEQRDALLASTRSAALALLEDLEHMRELANGWHHTSAELRRASAILRRLIVEDDLRNIGAPRIGKMHLKIPDYSNFYKAADVGELSLFASFNEMQIIVPKTMDRKMSLALHIDRNDRGMKYALARIDGFKSQRVFCYHGQWITRADVIKFVANNGSGVHSSQPTDQTLPSIRRMFTYNRSDNGDVTVFMNTVDGLNPLDKPLEYHPKKIDPVLAEILGCSRLIVESEDVNRLEAIVRLELGIAPLA